MYSFMSLEEFVADCGHTVVPGDIYWVIGSPDSCNVVTGAYSCDDCHNRSLKD